MKEIVADLAERTTFEKAVVSQVLTAFKEYVAEKVIAGDDVDMGKDFGSFTSMERKPRSYFIPPTGETRAFGKRRKMRFVPSAGRLKTLPDLDEKAP